jgi:hypothetical protein
MTWFVCALGIFKKEIKSEENCSSFPLCACFQRSEVGRNSQEWSFGKNYFLKMLSLWVSFLRNFEECPAVSGYVWQGWNFPRDQVHRKDFELPESPTSFESQCLRGTLARDQSEHWDQIPNYSRMQASANPYCHTTRKKPGPSGP